MLNNTLTKLSIIFIAFTASSQSALANSVLEVGAWEMHTTITMQDPKTGKDRTVNDSKSKHCFSPEYVAQNPYLNPNIDKAKMEQKQSTCSITDATQITNSAAWKMSCKTLDGHSVNVTINNTVSARQVQSNAEQEVKKDGKSVFAKINVTAKHIGECTSNMPKL